MTINCITHYQPFDLSIKGLTYLDEFPLETFGDYVKKIVAVALTIFLIAPVFILDGIFSSIYSVCSIVTYILPCKYGAQEPPANYAILNLWPLYPQEDGHEIAKHSLQCALELLDTDTKNRYLEALLQKTASESQIAWALASKWICDLVNKNIEKVSDDKKPIYESFRKLNQTQQENVVKKLLIPPFQGNIDQEAENVVTKIQATCKALAAKPDFKTLYSSLVQSITDTDRRTDAIFAPWHDKPEDIRQEIVLRHILPLYLDVLSSAEKKSTISKIHDIDTPLEETFPQLALVFTLCIALNYDPDIFEDLSLQAACKAIAALTRSEQEILLLQHRPLIKNEKILAAYKTINNYIQTIAPAPFIEDCHEILTEKNM